MLAAPVMVLLSLAVPAGAAPPDVGAMAPARSFLVVSVPNCKTAIESLKGTAATAG